MRSTAAGETEEEERDDAASLRDDAGEWGSVGGGPGACIDAVHVLIEVDGAIAAADAAHCSPVSLLDLKYLERLGLTDRLPAWRETCRSVRTPQLSNE